MTRNKVLGKGLSALISENDMDYDVVSNDFISSRNTLPIDNITAFSAQPRQNFDEATLAELAASIKQHGIITPIIVRAIKGSDKYQIIAGERRWRAAKISGLERVPVIIKNIEDKAALEIALIENIQRQDLTPIEEAEGLQKLIEEYSYTQEQIGEVVGKSRSHIANLLRLLVLPDEVKAMLSDGRLSMGHARALINAPNPLELAEKIISQGLNVRQAEKLASVAKPQKSRAKSNNHTQKFQDEDIVKLEEKLSENLGMKVKIEDSDQGGKVTIYFHNLEQLDTILQKLSDNSTI